MRIGIAPPRLACPLMTGNVINPARARCISTFSAGGSNWKFSNNSATKACISIMLHIERWDVAAVSPELNVKLKAVEGRGATYENFHPMHARTPAATGIVVGIVGRVTIRGANRKRGLSYRVLTKGQPTERRQRSIPVPFPESYAERSTYKFAKTPTFVCFPVSMRRNRSGFHVCASSPQTSGSLIISTVARVRARR